MPLSSASSENELAVVPTLHQLRSSKAGHGRHRYHRHNTPSIPQDPIALGAHWESWGLSTVHLGTENLHAIPLSATFPAACSHFEQYRYLSKRPARAQSPAPNSLKWNGLARIHLARFPWTGRGIDNYCSPETNRGTNAGAQVRKGRGEGPGSGDGGSFSEIQNQWPHTTTACRGKAI